MGNNSSKNPGKFLLNKNKHKMKLRNFEDQKVRAY